MMVSVWSDVRAGVRVRATSFMAMEPRVTLETRTSCRTWLGLGFRVRSGCGDAHTYLRTSLRVAFISATIIMTYG